MKKFQSFFVFVLSSDMDPKLSSLDVPGQSARMFLINPIETDYETPAASLRILINILLFSVVISSCFVMAVVWRRRMRKWMFSDGKLTNLLRNIFIRSH